MKVLFLLDDVSIFDPISPARARMRAYAAAIGELHVISTAPVGAVETSEETLRLHPFFAPKFFKTSTLAKLAHALVLKHGIEVVSAYDPFECGRAAASAIQGTNAKLHVQVHTDFLSPWFAKESYRNRSRLSVANEVLKQAAGIRTVSERVRASLAARYGSVISGISVIPPYVPAEEVAAIPLPPHSFTFALIVVGRLEEEKRVEDILRALKLASVNYPMTGLFVVGDGRRRRHLERKARHLGLKDRVIFLGNRPDAQGLMRSAHAFIQASAYEGYGRTLIEAALAKVPIITTDVGIVGEVFKGHEDVLVAPVAEPKELFLHMTRLLDGPRARVELPLHAEAAARAHLATQGNVPQRVAADLARLLVAPPIAA